MRRIGYFVGVDPDKTTAHAVLSLVQRVDLPLRSVAAKRVDAGSTGLYL